MLTSIIETDRIVLRPIRQSDLDWIHDLHSLPETDEYNTLGIPKDIEATKAVIHPWIEENQKLEITNYTFAIENKADGKCLGLFGFKIGTKKYKRGEVWYKLHPKYWKKGFATEALKAVIAFGFQTLKLHRIQAGCAVNNIGSIRVLEKCGMFREGRGRQILPLKTGWSDNFEYAILETDERKG